MIKKIISITHFFSDLCMKMTQKSSTSKRDDDDDLHSISVTK